MKQAVVLLTTFILTCPRLNGTCFSIGKNGYPTESACLAMRAIVIGHAEKLSEYMKQCQCKEKNS